MSGVEQGREFWEVVWDDAASNDGWVDVDADTTPERIVTRGWLIRKTETYLTLAASQHLSDENKNRVGSTQTIPCGMIVSKRKLKVTNASSKSRNNLRTKPGAEELHREPSKG
jgi:hypothetical protein